MDSFDWDDGNREKCRKHGMTIAEIESILREPLALTADLAHSGLEERFIAIGRTASGRFAFVAFTRRTRGERILLRPVSARFMHAREVRRYEQALT
jgi:uncharacterized protein